MTFLQQTLGKNYKWWYNILYNYNAAKSSISAFLIIQISKISEALITTYLWFLSNNSPESLSYLLIGKIYYAIIGTWYHEDLSYYISSGNLTTKILFPVSFINSQFFSVLGERLFKNFYSVLGYCVTAIIGGFIFVPLIINYSSILVLLLFLPISFFIQFASNFIVGSFTFFIKNQRDSWAFHNAYDTTSAILAGFYIPLSSSLVPTYFQYTPFAFLLHHPMQIYLGKYSTTEIIYTFLGGIAWCFVLWILARVVFKFGFKRNEAVGL